MPSIRAATPLLAGYGDLLDTGGAFLPAQAKALWGRFEFVYTPNSEPAM